MWAADETAEEGSGADQWLAERNVLVQAQDNESGKKSVASTHGMNLLPNFGRLVVLRKSVEIVQVMLDAEERCRAARFLDGIFTGRGHDV